MSNTEICDCGFFWDPLESEGSHVCRHVIELNDYSNRCNRCGYWSAHPYHEGENMQGQVMLNGKKNDQGKPMLGLVPRTLIWAVGSILTSGAVKYGKNNWRGGLLWSRPYDALLRHLTAWWDGEDKDAETGKSHLHHAACELAFLIEYEEKSLGSDDRYK